MPFDYSDLDAPETALLALEYLRSSARWFEEASEAAPDGEVARVFAEGAASSRSFAEDLERRASEKFGPAMDAGETMRDHTKRPAWLVVAGGETDYTAEELLEVAISEQEEHYQFFLGEGGDIDDSWVSDLFGELAAHARRLVVYLEGEREGVIDRDGA